MSAPCLLTRDQVDEIRTFALASGMNPREIKEARYPKMHLSTLYRIIYNTTYHDPLYTPPPHIGFEHSEFHKPKEKTATCNKCGEERSVPDDFYYYTDRRGNKYRHRSCKVCHGKITGQGNRDRGALPKRLASIDCKYTCPTCGSAYPEHGKEPFRTFNEAITCCRKAAVR
jgi:hypothetical protein